jgi:hypothetical protein
MGSRLVTAGLACGRKVRLTQSDIEHPNFRMARVPGDYASRLASENLVFGSQPQRAYSEIILIVLSHVSTN